MKERVWGMRIIIEMDFKWCGEFSGKGAREYAREWGKLGDTLYSGNRLGRVVVTCFIG